jgi:hypothetical protein
VFSSAENQTIDDTKNLVRTSLIWASMGVWNSVKKPIHAYHFLISVSSLKFFSSKSIIILKYWEQDLKSYSQYLRASNNSILLDSLKYWE